MVTSRHASLCMAFYEKGTLLGLQVLAGLDIKVKGVGVVGGLRGGLKGGVQEALVARVLPVLCMGGVGPGA